MLRVLSLWSLVYTEFQVHVEGFISMEFSVYGVSSFLC
jgi:hypothetical protein